MSTLGRYGSVSKPTCIVVVEISCKIYERVQYRLKRKKKTIQKSKMGIKTSKLCPKTSAKVNKNLEQKDNKG